MFIQAFLLEWYSTGKDLIPLKQRGFADFPITSAYSLSVPVAFVASKSVMRSLLLFPPWQSSPLNIKVLSGRHLKNNATNTMSFYVWIDK